MSLVIIVYSFDESSNNSLFISSSHQQVQHMTSQILFILIDFDKVF